MITAIYFDGGRILFDFDKPKACQRLAEVSPYDAATISAIIAARIEKLLESGKMSETAFCNELMHHCKTEGLTVPDVKQIWGNIITPNPVVDPFVVELMAKNMRLGVLSNTNGIHWPYIMQVPVMAKLQKYGAPFVLSYEVGASKPDRRIFDVALERLSAKPSEVLYIDDIMQYVDVARSLGMKSEQYDCTKNHPSRFEEILKAHNVL